MKKFISLLTALCLTASMSIATVSALTDSGGSGDSFLDSMNDKFSNLSMEERPQARWWLAEGYHTDETLIEGVETLYEQGYGGIELLCLSESSVDNDLYGWGTDEWYNDNYVIAKRASELGMTVSFAAGPSWQPTFPYYEEDPDYSEPEKWGNEYDTDPNSDVYNQGLVSADPVYVSSGQTTSIDLTEFTYDPDGTADQSSEHEPTLDTMGEINWQTDYHVTHRNFQTIAIAKVAGENGTELSLDGVTQYTEAEIQAMTEYDEETGRYTFRWTAPDDGSIYVLIPFWRIGVGHSTSSETKEKGDYYLANHFTSESAEAQFAFWRTYLFDDNMLSMLEEYGTKVDWFIDSMEYGRLNGEGIYWAYDFIDNFADQFDYDLTAYLPMLYSDYTISGLTSEEEDRIWDDVYEMMTNGFEEYLGTLKSLLNSIGVELRVQAYGLNELELSQPIKSLDVPETETLAFGDNVQWYKLLSGAVHLTGAQEFSSETGAKAGSYVFTAQEYIKQVHQQMAAGVNRTVWHGFTTLAGPDGDVIWPGYESSMGFTQSERWANRSPLIATEDYDYNKHITLLQTVLKEGQETVDVALLTSEVLAHPRASTSGGNSWNDTSLKQAGYSYEFFDADYLTEGDLCYLNEDGTLGLPKYQAVIVLPDQLPVSNAEALLNLAKQGLPVILLDSAASSTNTYNATDEDLAAVISELKTLDNVSVISKQSDAVSSLRADGIHPRLSYNGDLWNNRMESDDATYYYLYNEGSEAVMTTLSFDGEVVPYEMDTWSGEINAVSSYFYEDGRTSFAVTLAGGDTKVFILNENADTSDLHTVTTTADSARLTSDGVVLEAASSGSYTAELSDGTQVSGEIAVPQITQPASWQVSIEAWTADLTPNYRTETKTNSITGEYTSTEVWYDTSKDIVFDEQIASEDLDYWRYMDALQEATGKANGISGIGYYTTSFTLPDEWNLDTDGLKLDLGYFEGTAMVYLNGILMPQVNINAPVLDLTCGLQQGENEIKIMVTTTLTNVLLNDPESYGAETSRFYTDTWWAGMADVIIGRPLEQSYGLKDISLQSYSTVICSVDEQEADKEILGKVIAYAEERTEDAEFEQVIEEVQNSFLAALEHAKDIYADRSAEQEQVDAAWQTLMTEIHKLGFVRGDKTSLSELIQVAEKFQMQIELYTPSTAEPFTVQLTAAKAVLEDGNAMQTEVDQAESALLNAMVALRFRADKSVLETVLAKAEEVDPSAYTAESVAAFNAANQEAQDVRDNPDASQDEVDSAIDNLNAALDNLVPLDKASANGTVNRVEGDTIRKVDSGNVKTGETAPVAAAVALLAVAAAGFVALKKK